jgi:UDP-glucose 6-dehydrogenase
MNIQDRLRSSRPEDLSPEFLHEVADLIDELKKDVIVINDENGEEIAKIEGSLAAFAISEGTSRLVNEALREMMEEWEAEHGPT